MYEFIFVQSSLTVITYCDIQNAANLKKNYMNIYPPNPIYHYYNTKHQCDTPNK